MLILYLSVWITYCVYCFQVALDVHLSNYLDFYMILWLNTKATLLSLEPLTKQAIEISFCAFFSFVLGLTNIIIFN